MVDTEAAKGCLKDGKRADGRGLEEFRGVCKFNKEGLVVNAGFD